MRKNDDITIEITGYTADGAGVGRHEGMAVFVPCAAIGDVCRVHIIKVASSYAVGKLTEVISPSADRVEPACPVFHKCGGCAFMHISYKAELKAKWQTVYDAITRIGGIDGSVMSEILGAPDTKCYRNKAAFPVQADASGKAIFGFYARKSHRVIPCGECYIQAPLASKIAAAVCDFMNKHAILPYDELSGKGLVRHIFVRTAADGGAQLTLVINGKKLPLEAEFVKYMCEHFPMLCGISLSVNTKNTNVIMGAQMRTLWGVPYLVDVLCGNRFEISPLSFYQVNRDQCERLYELALNAAKISENDTVFDLYCGIGTMTQLFAKKAGRVYGVEIVESAVENARRSAKENGFENIEFVCGDAPTAALELKEKGVIPDVVVVDPPRAGLGGTLAADIAAMAPQRVVYVSCNPATLARDLKLFAECGYKTQSVTPVDMFPRTHHVETVASLTRVSND